MMSTNQSHRTQESKDELPIDSANLEGDGNIDEVNHVSSAEVNVSSIASDGSENVSLSKGEKPTPAKYSEFSTVQKYLILVIVTVAGFLGPVSGNIYIPILPLLQDVFRVSNTCINATVSVFMFVFAFAPLLWASWADFGGRKTLYLVSLLFFIAANVLLAALPANIVALFILRVVQAFGASSVMSVGAGTIADVFEPQVRARAISYFMLGPQLGPVLGPILSMIAANGQWRWIFGFLAIFSACVYLVILFFLPETLRYLVGNGRYFKEKSYVLIPRLYQRKIVEDSAGFPKPPRPSLKGFLMIMKYKPIMLCSINGGLLFATFYGVSVTFTQVLRHDYGFNTLEACLSYLCPGVSLVSGSIIGGRISDSLRRNVIKKNPTKYIPENRFSIQIVGLLISMAGVLGYGWCVHKHVHVVSIFVFTFLTGFGMTWVFVTSTTYLTECASGQPATNVALANLMRNLAAAISSLVIDKLIEKETFGWCFTGLAMLDMVGIAIVVLLLIRGPVWRKQFEERKLQNH
ncbi:Piso0_000575 [Millerozyma farinosa CBS 7064]|uniref:Piso0_000575 protein n=1 Tax=Pichia sorbitophila (strain ATCC MYA-4447 / BCRC 22081 / CBS 7064 / NBRC 10061 / NRRL Y-12695) TaxID=559304 RepID=G8YSR6_PICSO|nr:Piso0_000575 [Millerozyma farinosa CBS 7064]CCE73528.1 Piso0_000575 [Millerozyma farinosa CBS 7064]